MLITSFVAGPWQSNCYLVAAAEPGPCVVLDAGIGAAAGVQQVCEQHGWTPVGVLGSHGHIDHVGDAAPVAAHFAVPVWLHPADQVLLTRPGAGLSGQGVEWVAQLLGGEDTLPAPDRVNDLVDGDCFDLAGLRFQVAAAPGHTRGSCLLHVSHDDQVVTFTGDVVFAGSIGRMDLPGGSASDMARTLSEVVLALPDDRVLLPGHGPRTTMGAERASNPYLQPRALASLMEEDN